MQATQANRARIAERAASRPARRGTGIYTGPLTEVAPAGFSARKSKRPGADKGQPGWNRTPYYKTAATIDSRWSA